MGLIKTAMMSGAAMYGVSQLSKAAQSRNNNSPPPRSEYSDRNYGSYRPQPLEFREPSYQDPRYVNNQDGQAPRHLSRGEPRQALHLNDQQPYYVQEEHREHPQYEYASDMRSPSAFAQYHRNQHGPRGFVEPEITDDPREPQHGNGGRADMVNMLAQQAMGMGLVGSKRGKDKDSKGDLLGSLIGR